MNNELSKQLKDTGFKGRWNPTLSELIEACGDGDYFDLERWNELDINKKWLAVSLGESANGETPEIAVAKLWLKLNK